MDSLSICVSTYKRPEGLKSLLESIVSQKDVSPYLKEIRVVIADNESPPQTEKIGREFDGKAGIRIVWDHEPQQGITYARNKTFRLSRGTDFCFFVDDDQVLDPYCLSELFRIQNQYQADMVYGNAPPVFADQDISE